MKKFSKSAAQALSELNITPLLDLCFVLLVIFIITTAPPSNQSDLDLPKAVSREKEPKPKANYVTIDRSGKVFLNRQEMDMSILLNRLIEMRTKDPDINIVVRGDKKTKHKFIMRVLEIAEQANIGRVNLATDPKNK